jgi:hypothetical protein
MLKGARHISVLKEVASYALVRDAVYTASVPFIDYLKKRNIKLRRDLLE